MQRSFNFKEKRFAVYGLGLTGKSVVKFLKKNKANKIFIWDDYSIKSNQLEKAKQVQRNFR